MKFNEFLHSIHINESTDDNQSPLDLAKIIAKKISLLVKHEEYQFLEFGNKSIEARLHKDYLQHVENPKSVSKEKRYIVTARLQYIESRQLFFFEISNGNDELYESPAMTLESFIKQFKTKKLDTKYNDYIDWRLVNKFVKAYDEVISGNLAAVYPSSLKKLADKYNLKLIDTGVVGQVKIIFNEPLQNIEFLKTLISSESFKLNKDKSSISKGSLDASAFTNTKNNEKYVLIKFKV